MKNSLITVILTIVMVMDISGGSLSRKPRYSNLKIDSTISIDSCIERIYLSCDIDSSIFKVFNMGVFTLDLSFYDQKGKFFNEFSRLYNENETGLDSIHQYQFGEEWNKNKYHLMIDRFKNWGRYYLDREKKKLFILVKNNKKTGKYGLLRLYLLDFQPIACKVK